MSLQDTKKVALSLSFPRQENVLKAKFKGLHVFKIDSAVSDWFLTLGNFFVLER